MLLQVSRILLVDPCHLRLSASKPILRLWLAACELEGSSTANHPEQYLMH